MIDASSLADVRSGGLKHGIIPASSGCEATVIPFLHFRLSDTFGPKDGSQRLEDVGYGEILEFGT